LPASRIQSEHAITLEQGNTGTVAQTRWQLTTTIGKAARKRRQPAQIKQDLAGQRTDDGNRITKEVDANQVFCNSSIKRNATTISAVNHYRPPWDHQLNITEQSMHFSLRSARLHVR